MKRIQQILKAMEKLANEAIEDLGEEPVIDLLKHAKHELEEDLLSHPIKKDPIITVCAACKRACCWQGKFMCEDAIGADTEEVRESELLKLKLEHPDFWKEDPNYEGN